MHGLKLLLLGCCVLLPLVSSPCRSDTAYLQPASVYLGDVAELVIEFDSGTPSLYPLDISALAADFVLLDKKSRVMRLLDTEQATHRMQWRLQLAPRRSGSIAVPEFYFDDRSTPPLRLEVTPVPPALQSSQNVYIEMESASLAPYVGQQTQIEMRLYHNTPVSDVRLLEPQVGAALIYPQLEEEVFSVTKNGREYRVRGRGMALFPQSAGEMKLMPAAYYGVIGSTAETAIPGTRRIFRRSNSLSLQVRARPAEFSGRFWLPATGLELSQRWEQAGENLRVGDSLDWTLTIIARGLPAEALPQDLLKMESGNLRIYADQPTRSNRFDGRQMIGRMEQRFAVIASQPGTIDLPEITLKWWDIVSDSEQQARLAARTIQVAAAATPSNGQVQGDWDTTALRSVLAGDGARRLWVLSGLVLLVSFIAALRWSRSRFAARLKSLLQRRRHTAPPATLLPCKRCARRTRGAARLGQRALARSGDQRLISAWEPNRVGGTERATVGTGCGPVFARRDRLAGAGAVATDRRAYPARRKKSKTSAPRTAATLPGWVIVTRRRYILSPD